MNASELRVWFHSLQAIRDKGGTDITHLYILAFRFVSAVVVPFWLLMILLPKWEYTYKIMSSFWVVAMMALPYAILETPLYLAHLPHFLNPQFGYINQILAEPRTTSLAWIHFIAVDLFAGRWIYLDSRERNTNVWIMAPILSLVLLFGPTGITIYLGFRAWQSRQANLAPLGTSAAS